MLTETLDGAAPRRCTAEPALVCTLASFASWLAGLGCEATGIVDWLLPVRTGRKLYSTLRVSREALVRSWPMEPVAR